MPSVLDEGSAAPLVPLLAVLPNIARYRTQPILGGHARTHIPPFGFVELTVVFAPMQTGDFSAELVIESDDPSRATVRVALFGRGES